MRTAPSPCQVRWQDSRCLLDMGVGMESAGGSRGPPDPGFSPFRVWEGPAARGLALGGSGDGARIQTLPWDAGV